MRAAGDIPDNRVEPNAQTSRPKCRPSGGLGASANDAPGKPEQSYAESPADHVCSIGVAHRVSGCSGDLIQHMRPDRPLPWLTVKAKRAIRYDAAGSQHVVIQLVD